MSAGDRGLRVRLAAAVLAGTVLLSLGGCVVGSERGSGGSSAKVEEVLDRGEGRFDLTTAPSRAEAGMPDGRSQVTYQRRDKRPFQVVVALPEGKELALDARLVGFDSLSTAGADTAPPTTLDIHHYPGSLAEGRDHLLAAAEEFGLDRGAIDDWYAQAAGSGSGSGTGTGAPTVRSRWIDTTVGYLRLQVQGRYGAPVDAPDPGRVVVHYLFTWDQPPGDSS